MIGENADNDLLAEPDAAGELAATSVSGNYRLAPNPATIYLANQT